MKPRIRSAWCLAIACWLLVAGVAAAQNGIILDQQLDASHQGYTVIRVWGSHYEMGYAQANLLGDHVVSAVADIKLITGSSYNALRSIMAAAVWEPPGIEDEFDGMVASLSETHPSAHIDKLDLKVSNTYGDWGYACRSHICWGRYVAPPVKTLATRRLDFGSPVPSASHHVLCARDPDDGSPRWVNLGWPGSVAVATGVNEFGTLASLHDYGSFGADLSPGRMPRMVAARHALTFPSGGDLASHATDVFSELRRYQIMTGGFLNYYAPEGHGGVMTADPYQTDPDFHHLRLPQGAWHHGEAMITTNSWTDGTITPIDEDFGADAYYGNESAKTLESHWNLLAGGSNALHLMSVAYRGRGDMTLWADGRLGGAGRTPRLEWEWGRLFGAPCADGLDNDGDDLVDLDDPDCTDPADPLEAPDADGDLVEDDLDNCLAVSNSGQEDTDADDIGNICDCDFNQSLTCNIDDFNVFLPDFVAAVDSGIGTDMDSDATVGIGDFDLFLPGFIAGVPGPSGLAQCIAEGDSRPAVPGAPPCCPGLDPIGCDAPVGDICPVGPCVGASICADCGNGICGPGENICNCPGDCPL